MRGRKTSLVIVVTPEERKQMEHWIRSTTTPLGLARRAKAVLLVSEGLPLVEAGRQAGLSERHTRKWVGRFLNAGLDHGEERLKGLEDAARPGRPRLFRPGGGSARGEDSV